MQKTFIIALLALTQLYVGMTIAQAQTGVGHGGGAEYNVIKCNAYLGQQQKLELSVCLTGESNQAGQYEIIPCGRGRTAYVTIQRSLHVTTQDRVIETVQIPGQLFSVFWSTAGFVLKMDDPRAGSLSLVREGPIDKDRGTTLKLNLPTMKANLKSVTCDFGSN